MTHRLLYAVALAATLPMAAQAAVSISINIAPPPLPVYVQPPIPAANYLWTPGYWRWDPVGADYFWVPGTWVAPPAVGLLWTPGYWGWGGGGYAWHGGYWGPHVGFYGGVNYGFGYIGSGYHGGYWQGGAFTYNRSVNNINTTIVHNVYNERVVENNTHVSFNGGQGGIAARESPQEHQWHAEAHVPPTPAQRSHEQVAMHTPEQRAAVNHGTPAMAAMERPAAPARGARGEPGMPGGPAEHARAESEAPRGEPHGEPHGPGRGEPHREAHGGGGHERER